MRERERERERLSDKVILRETHSENDRERQRESLNAKVLLFICLSNECWKCILRIPS